MLQMRIMNRKELWNPVWKEDSGRQLIKDSYTEQTNDFDKRLTINYKVIFFRQDVWSDINTHIQSWHTHMTLQYKD